MIKLNRKSKKLLLLQRNELLTDRQIKLRKKFGRFIFTNFFINYFQNTTLEQNSENLFLREVETFKKYLPKNVKNIMDVGCGLGIIDIYLNRIFNNPKFFLLDKNRIDKKIKYGFSLNYESYNDLNETKNLLLNNEIKLDQINLVDVEKTININEKIDLVISLKSMGYHYPLENYLNLFKKHCSQDAIFIFDISKGNYNNISLTKIFKKVEVIYEESSIHPLNRVCCKGLF